MSLARRMMTSVGGITAPGQVEYGPTGPGVYHFTVPDGVFEINAVGIAAGLPGSNVSPFTGGTAGNLHWRNKIAVTPGEILEVLVGSSVRNASPIIPGLPATQTHIRRGTDYLIRAGRGSTLYHTTLGGGGGQGGSGGSGRDANGGCGGGGPGYMGMGGRGGNYLDTSSGQFPETDSGGGRGGDMNGVPTGWASSQGEGTGLLGRSADKTTSLGAKLYGAGAFADASYALNGGVRITWAGGREYPDRVPDLPSSEVALLISAAGYTGSLPAAFTVHGEGALPGDLALVYIQANGSGSIAGITGGDGGWLSSGQFRWKQLTEGDLDASEAGTLTISGSGASMSWAVLVYHGPRTIERRTTAFQAADDVVVPGFKKRVDCKCVIVIGTDPDAGAGAIPAPAGFTSRVSRAATPRYLIADIKPKAYVDDTPVTLTNMVATAGGSGALYELY
ncbi:hypothetical protein [Phenylobacterium koreense]|uniref:Uncharacterized protein n=1 Tax=Phenylobacterium koreense TaxID=266125 RepID=A0ABV2EGL6_9CAUL